MLVHKDLLKMFEIYENIWKNQQKLIKFTRRVEIFPYLSSKNNLMPSQKP